MAQDVRHSKRQGLIDQFLKDSIPNPTLTIECLNSICREVFYKSNIPNCFPQPLSDNDILKEDNNGIWSIK